MQARIQNRTMTIPAMDLSRPGSQDHEVNQQGSQNHAPAAHGNTGLNTALWTVQVLWGVFFSLTGLGKIVCYNPAVWNQTLHDVSWFSAVPQGLFVFIGVCEFLGGVGLILPAMSGVKPKLTPLAGYSLALVMILAAGFHIARGEYILLLPNLVLAAGAAFIAYGRLSWRPIAPAPVTAFRALKGFAVLGALILIDVAPVWYRLTHTH